MNPFKTILESGVIPYILIQNLNKEEFEIAKRWGEEIKTIPDFKDANVYFTEYHEEGACLRINPWEELREKIYKISNNAIILVKSDQMKEAAKSGLFTIMSLEEFKKKYSSLVTFPNF